MRLDPTWTACAALSCAVALAGVVHASGPAALPSPSDEPDPGATLLIRANRVIVRPGEVLEGASVLVRDGRIAKVGPDLEVPDGATVVEGDTVSAAFVDLWSALGLAATVVADTGASPSTRAAAALDPFTDAHLRRAAVRAGVTTARVAGGYRGTVGGLGAFVRLAPELPSDATVLSESGGLAMGIGLSREAQGQFFITEDGEWTMQQGSQAMDPFDRLDQVERLGAQLESGRSYREEQIEFRYSLAEWQKAIAEKEKELEKGFKKAQKDREKEQKDATEKGKEFKEKRYREDRRPREPKYDEDREVLGRVADGEIPLVVEVHRAAEIRYLLEVTRPFDRLRLIIAGGSEATACVEELAQRRIAVIVWPSLRGTAHDDEFHGPGLSLAAELHAAGVQVLFGSGGREAATTPDLPLLAAVAVGHGLDPQAAFAALTADAARVMDLGHRLGTVEVGREAELIVADGDPMNSTSRITHVISGGRLVLGPNN